ncbi:MAG: tyrosine-type recombinase/integrase, partial [Dehalococcoidia bacterium]
MLTKLFPRMHRRFSSLPILGPVVDGFAEWLFQQGYPRDPVRRHVRSLRRVDLVLRKRGFEQLSGIAHDDLRACSPADSQDDVDLAAALRCVERYLEARGRLMRLPQPPSRSRALLSAYAEYLEDVQGFARSTVPQHLRTNAQLLEHLGYETTPSRLRALSARDLEDFLRITGAHQGRGSLQHVVAHVRGFLRFLAGRGEVPPGLETRIDTPRLYRLEQLPRALPWETVRAFLRSIDRTTPMGRRDYAMFLLIATYGLRTCDIAALKLDDIQWQTGQLHITQRKGEHPLSLPLTDEVGAALVGYLRRGRPKLPCREVFLRCRAPAGVIKPTAVTEAFQGCSRRSGLKISFQGPHCLRHSYAVHLLRQGVPLKTIGDVLGHRSAEATCTYLRLS